MTQHKQRVPRPGDGQVPEQMFQGGTIPSSDLETEIRLMRAQLQELCGLIHQVARFVRRTETAVERSVRRLTGGSLPRFFLDG